MASIFENRLGGDHEKRVEWKETGTDVDGATIYAPVVALEPGSIGGGGAGGGGDGAILDGVAPTIKATVTGAKALKVDGSAVTQPVSLGAAVDISDRVARLLGHVTVDSSVLPTGAATETTLAAVNTKLPASMVAVNNADNDAGRVGLVSDARSRVWNGTGWDRLPGTTAGAYSQIRVAGVTVDPRDRNWTITETVPTSLATNTPDVTDRAARLLGHVTVDNASLAVTGPLTDTQLRASAVTVDVNDRVGRLLGHVTVDNATLAVTGPLTDTQLRASAVPVSGPLTDTQLRASAVPVSGTVTANQGGAPWSQNLTQVGGVALALKALPANADGLTALPVWPNAQQLATYDAGARGIVTGALTANTAKAVLSIEHAASSTKTVKIRRIIVHMIQTTALSGSIDLQIQTGTAASSAGTVRTPSPRKKNDPAAEAVVKTLPTITAATLQDVWPAGGFATTTTLYSPPIVVFDWQENGEAKPLMLRAGVLETIVLNAISTAAHNLTMVIAIDFTEE